MNLDAWKALPASYQKMVELACNDANFWLMGAAEASQGEAIAFHESQGVTIHQWSPEFIEAYRQAWQGGRRGGGEPRIRALRKSTTATRRSGRTTPSGARSPI